MNNETFLKFIRYLDSYDVKYEIEEEEGMIVIIILPRTHIKVRYNVKTQQIELKTGIPDKFDVEMLNALIADFQIFRDTVNW